MKTLLLCLLLLITSHGFAAPVITTDTPAGAFNAQGNAAYDAKNYTEAAALFQKAVALVPSEVNYVTNLASAQRQAGEFAEAQKLLQGALESFTGTDAVTRLQIALADNHFFWARALIKSDKRADAIAHYQAAAAIDRLRRPKDAGYDLSNLGSSFHILGRDTEALAAYQESLTQRRALPIADRDRDDEASSLGGVITANLALSFYDAAASAYEELRKLKPEAAPEYEAALLTAQAEAHGPNGQNAGAKAAAAALNRLGLAEAQAKRYDKAIASYRRAMELRPTVEAYVLNLARALSGAKRSAEAISLIESKLTLFPDPADRKELMIEWADAHYSLGQAQAAQSRWAAVLPHYFAAYSVDRVARRRDAALDLRHAGEAEVSQFRFEAAQKYFRRSAETAEEAGEPEIEAISLRLLGQNLNRQQQFAAAIEVLQKALPLTRAQKMPLEEGRVLVSLGTSTSELSRYPEALNFQRQALAIFQELGNQGEAAVVFNNLGSTSYQLMRYDDARSFYLQSLNYARSIHDTAGEAGTLANLGHVSDSQSRYAEAISYFRQAIALCPPNSRLLQKPHALQGMGTVYNDMGRPQEAVRLTKEALAIFRREGDRSGESTCLNNIGLFYVTLGEYDRAIDYYRQALALRRILGQRTEEATDLNNLGELYHTVGQPGKAVEFYEQALTIHRAIGDQSGVGETLSNQAVVYADTSDSDPVAFEKAEALYQQALTLFRQAGNEDRAASVLGNLGSLNSHSHPIEAQKYLEQSRDLHQRTGNANGQSSVLNNLANLAARQRHPAEAAGYYGQAVMLASKTKNKDTLTYSWNGLMLLNAATDPAWAIYCGKNAVNLLQSVRGNLKSFDKAVQKKYLDVHSTSYRTLAQILIKQGRLDEAQQVLGMLKEEEFFDFLGRDPAAAKTLTATAALSPFEADWSGRFEKATDRAAFLAEMARAFQTIAPGQSSVVRRRTLPAGTAAVYTIVEPDKLQLILTTPAGQVAREYPIAAPDLYRKVLALRSALQDPTRDPRPLAQELYKIVVGPLEADLAKAHATTLLWSLDDALRYLPVAALYDGKHYLVEHYDNALLTLAAPARAATAGSVPWTGLGLGVSREHPGFDALPGVRAELSGIFGPVVPGTALLDSQFTQRTFLAGLKHRNHPLVHIASHFALSGRDTDSFLLLGDGGHLSLAELKVDPNVFGGVDLLTLSACNTAMEVRSAGGKEVEGFGALAQRLGARSVLASLWPVADASTPTLMREFYRLRHGSRTMSKAAGLRQAQLELLRGKVTASTPPSKTNRARRAKIAGASNTDLPLFVADPKAPYAHPFYWAPFVLIGNPL